MQGLTDEARMSNPGVIPPLTPRSPTFQIQGGWVSRVVASDWPLDANGRIVKEKRVAHAMLLVLAAYADAGIEDPSINELHALAEGQWPRWLIVETVDRLERKGWIEVTRPSGDYERNQYHLRL
jgi:hypothetical protein